MKKNYPYKSLFLVFLLSSPISSAIESNTGSTPVTMTYSQNKQKKLDSVDGVTSASQLRAKKSHAAAKENENKVTIFLGLMIIAIILFFWGPFSKNN